MIKNHDNTVAGSPFLAWRRRLGISRTDAAKLLARTERQVLVYERTSELNQTIVLSMAALEFLPTWRLSELGIEPRWRTRPNRRVPTA